MGTFSTPVVQTISSFLAGIGLEVRAEQIEGRAFVPGIQIRYGTLVVDEAHLTYPGDLLHEAGHLAVVPPAGRKAMHIDVGNKAREEMAAIAWSYAAALHLGIDPAIVFHEGGYGGGAYIPENFRAGRYIGVPMLQWLGLTGDDYPEMLRWTVD